MIHAASKRGLSLARRAADRKRPLIDDRVIPKALQTAERVAQYPDELNHERARPVQAVTAISE